MSFSTFIKLQQLQQILSTHARAYAANQNDLHYAASNKISNENLYIGLRIDIHCMKYILQYSLTLSKM